MLVELERLGQSPLMLERLEPAGGHSAGCCLAVQVFAIQPGVPGRTVDKTGNAGCDRSPATRASCDHSRPSRPEKPLMAARHEEITPKIIETDVLTAERVDAVHAEEHAGCLVPVPVRLVQYLRDTPDRKLQSGAGMDPGDREHAGCRRDRLCHALDEFV